MAPSAAPLLPSQIDAAQAQLSAQSRVAGRPCQVVIVGTLMFAASCAALHSYVSSDLQETQVEVNREDTVEEVEVPAYRPVLLMHGLMEGSTDFEQVAAWISEEHPQTSVFNLRLFEGGQSFQPLPQQVTGVAAQIRSIASQNAAAFARGYHLVCHSQGALICRAVCEEMNDHRVHTLVSLAGPQMGVYGGDWLARTLPQAASNIPFLGMMLGFGGATGAQNFYHAAYTPVAQNTISIANMWVDPLHWNEFIQGSDFLPANNAGAGDRKANFVRLQKAVFLVGSFTGRTSDGALGIEPWQSGIFGFYAEGSESRIVPMEEQQVFTEDLFGLSTLNSTGRLHVEAVEGVEHAAWLHSRSVFNEHVLGHLV